MAEWEQELRRRLAGLGLPPSRELDIIEELSQHLQERYEELRNSGVSEGQARHLALEELLDEDALASRLQPLGRVRAATPVVAGAPSRGGFADLWQDVRYAARMLRRQPGFAATAVLTLALGIGVNSAIFALVDATLLRPLPFPDPDRLVMLWERSEGSDRGPVAPLNMADWETRSHTLDRVGAFVPGVGGMVMTGADGTAETVARQWVLSGFFDALGVKAVAGRTFQPSDDAPTTRAVVLSAAFWRLRFAADPSIVGRSLRLDGDPYTVVGVVPNESQLLGETSIWGLIPFIPNPALRGAYFLGVVGRLKPGVTIAEARADLDGVAAALARDYPKTNSGRAVTIAPMREAVIGQDLRLTATLFLGVVGIVLLLCCANVANLLLARATVRTRELAIRSALGASRPRVIRQLLTESLVLSAVGGALGAGLGAAILYLAPLIVPPGLLPVNVALSFNLHVLTFCAVTALGVGLLFGGLPAWHATGLSSRWTISEMAPPPRGHRIRGLLVAAEISTAALLLVGAGLLLRTLVAVERVDLGYEADRVLTMMVDPLGSRYPTPEKLSGFFEAIEHEVVALPGIRSVAWTSSLPLRPPDDGPRLFEIVGDPPVAESQRPTARYQAVSPDYFQTVDLAVVSGRGFNQNDRRQSVQVCIVDEAFVRKYANGRSPVGMQLALRPAGSPQAPAVVREVVGVARQVKERPDETEASVQVYVPLAQNLLDDLYLLVRPASGDASALTPSVRAAIGRVDTEQLVSVRDISTLADIAWDATARHRFRAVLVTTFAALALLLAMVGVFGILAYHVQQHVHDFGVRRALGATTNDVVRIVVGSAVGVIGIGALIGLACSAVWGRLLSAMLYGVQPFDPLTFVAVPIVLLVTAALAAAAPAWRAARIDPAVALRNE